MQKAIYLWVLISFAVAGCGGGGEDTPQTPAPSPNAPVLSSIGNQTVNSGDTLTFTVTATDPNNLDLVLATDGSVGSGANPYSGTGSDATFNINTGVFNWNTTGVALGSYVVSFTVMNSASYTDSETITISIQNQQFAQGQTLYNNNCKGSGCHRNEDANTNEGAQFGVLCSPESAIKTATETGPGGMPTFNFNASQEAAISFYLLNVRPADC